MTFSSYRARPPRYPSTAQAAFDRHLDRAVIGVEPQLSASDLCPCGLDHTFGAHVESLSRPKAPPLVPAPREEED